MQMMHKVKKLSHPNDWGIIDNFDMFQKHTQKQSGEEIAHPLIACRAQFSIILQFEP